MISPKSIINDIPQLPLYRETEARIAEIIEKVEEIKNPEHHDRNICMSGGVSFLYELAAGFHSPMNTPGYCIEFGTYLGGASTIIASALKDYSRLSPLFTIDIYDPAFPHIYDEETEEHKVEERVYENLAIAQNTFKKLDLKEHICSIIYNDILMMKHWNLPIRFAFIDSDHTYKHTQELIRFCMTYLVQYGWLAIHDYFDYTHGKAEDPPVISAVNDYLKNQNMYKIQPYKATLGMICLQLLEKLEKQ